jgi:anthranilate phosphoribosyltransferase
VVLNAAAALHVADGGGMDEAITRAGQALDSGAALEKLSRLIEVYSAS